MTEGRKEKAGDGRMQYQEAVRYIGEIPRFTEKHTLEHTGEFLRRLGAPCRDRRVIHVAGTNGKGSVCAYIQAMLRAQGKRTGLFTSPHLVRMNERIQIDGEPVADREFTEVFQRTLEAVKGMERDGFSHPSYFELLYGMGMTAFERADVEYVILETGLGGRLDATNSFPTPVCTVITSIGLDHTEILGDTIEQIAAEKAGILKAGVPVIFDGTTEAAAVVIRRKAAQIGAPCREIGKDAFEIREITEKSIAFSLFSEYDKNTPWRVRGTGLYQVQNAALAVAAMECVLGPCGDREAWKRALAEVVWPGRMEEVLPGVVLDGAHNLPAIRRFVESVSVQEAGRNRRTVILFSAVADKDCRGMIRELCAGDAADVYVVTGIGSSRGAAAGALAELFRECTDKPVFLEAGVKAAFRRAMEEKGEEGRLYCLGSLYLIGELKAQIGGRDAEF